VTALALKSESVSCEQPGGLCHLYESGTRTLETLRRPRKAQISLFLVRLLLFPRAWMKNVTFTGVKSCYVVSVKRVCSVMPKHCYVWDQHKELTCVWLHCENDNGCLAFLSSFVCFSFSFLAPFYQASHSSTFIRIQKVPSSDLVHYINLKHFKIVFLCLSFNSRKRQKKVFFEFWNLNTFAETHLISSTNR
jgi:hypothetical protein